MDERFTLARANLHLGTIRESPGKKRIDLERMRAGSRDLAVARVLEVDYEEMYVTLETVIGTDDTFPRSPIPLTFPGAGHRHFFGAMPDVGDFCVVGWVVSDSTTSARQGTKIPVILSWVVPGVWPGREWVTTAGYNEEELSLLPKDQDIVRGVSSPVRHKLRHMQPGNVVASSSQGSDMVLDEGVTLANRRGNEIRLRDPDQAFVVRSLQEFHANAGARLYAGMVQRDADLLPTTMFSDGYEWDGFDQAPLGVPLTDNDLSSLVSAPDGFLTPAKPFGRKPGANGPSGGMRNWQSHLDPFEFLQLGGLLTSDGYAANPNSEPETSYGGKPIYRVAAKNASEAAGIPNVGTLTEWRVELAHTSDGTLPVSEQTDMFDADRLPSSGPDDPGASPNAPFVEWVLGSVVGNDSFTDKGRASYGLPLVPRVFDGDTANPRMVPALPSRGGDAGININEHAASLFMVRPIDGISKATWWAVNKQGQLKAVLGGPEGGNSAEVLFRGGLKLRVQGKFDFNPGNGFHSTVKGRGSIRLRAEQGPVEIYGGGTETGAEGAFEGLFGTSDKGGGPPAVKIESNMSARIRAQRQLDLHGRDDVLVHSEGTVRVRADNNVELSSAKGISFSTEELKCSTSARRTDAFAGPKGLLPTNAPLHERTYTPSFPGVTAEKVTYEMGDREEKFTLGNHTTEILVGDMTYKTLMGTFTAQAATSKLTMSMDGINATAGLGNISLTATAGAINMTASAAVNISATAGPVNIRSSSAIILGTPGAAPDLGPVLCGLSREPFTNLPFSTFGIGAKTVLVTT